MWDVALPALIGVGSSLLVLGLPRVLDGRTKQLRLRQDWVMAFLESEVLEDIEHDSAEEQSSRDRYGLMARVPEPPTSDLVASRGRLEQVRSVVTGQVGDLYELRLRENVEGRWFSDDYDAAVAAFKTRLIRWSHGRLPLSRVRKGTK